MEQSPLPKTPEMPDFRAMEAQEAEGYAYALNTYEDAAAVSRKEQAEEVFHKHGGVSAVSKDGQSLPADKSENLKALEVVEQRNAELGQQALAGFVKGETPVTNPYTMNDAKKVLSSNGGSDISRRVAINKAQNYKRDNPQSGKTVGRFSRIGYETTEQDRQLDASVQKLRSMKIIRR